MCTIACLNRRRRQWRHREFRGSRPPVFQSISASCVCLCLVFVLCVVWSAYVISTTKHNTTHTLNNPTKIYVALLWQRDGVAVARLVMASSSSCVCVYVACLTVIISKVAPARERAQRAQARARTEVFPEIDYTNANARARV